MSKIDCTVRFCPTCQAETKRNPCGACRPCKARRTAKYRASHPEKVKAGIDAWRIENKTKANASSTSWAAANPEKVLASSAAWKKSNKQAVHIHNQNRRARKCACCGKYIRQAYYMQAGRTYGPTCGKRLGLDKPNWQNPVTRHKFHAGKSPQKAVVQDGQEQLFMLS